MLQHIKESVKFCLVMYGHNLFSVVLYILYVNKNIIDVNIKCDVQSTSIICKIKNI